MVLGSLVDCSPWLGVRPMAVSPHPIQDLSATLTGQLMLARSGFRLFLAAPPTGGGAAQGGEGSPQGAMR